MRNKSRRRRCEQFCDVTNGAHAWTFPGVCFRLTRVCAPDDTETI